MSTELPKTYDPHAVEAEAYDAWTREHAFHAEPTDPGNPYAIVIPPPNVTAALHLGHALNNTIQDILTRYHRMLGDNAVWLPGTDHAGIATQTVVEKRVMQEEGKRRTEFARDEFVAKIQAWKDEYEQKITAQLKAMGCSCDWDRQAFTMDEPRAKAVREAFFQLFKDGLIYRGKRLVNWDPVTQTALADDEVEMEEVDGSFYYLRYPLVDDGGDKGTTGHGDKGQRDTGLRPVPRAQRDASSSKEHGSETRATYVIVATTRPETMLGDTAVAMNPKDPRAAALRGKRILLPIVNREIPIIEDDYVVLSVEHGGDPADPKAQFATGFLKVTPAHDPNDYDIGQRHNLPQINVMAPDASISDKHGWPADDASRADAFFRESLLGKTREEARKLVVRWFKDHGLLEDVKPYKHSVGHSYRSHVPIEPYLSDQWYCKVTDDRLRGAALRSMASDERDTGLRPVDRAQRSGPPSAEHGSETHATWEGQLRFYPSRYAKTFQTWHENIRDWCISRQLWWGHRIPIWTSQPETGNVAKLEQEQLQAAAAQRRILDQIYSIIDVRRAAIVVCSRSAEADSLLADLGYVQDPDVLDTWFSSALWPMSTLMWPEESAIRDPKSALNTWNPSSVLTTAREIITLWVSRMVMFNLYFRDRLPFYDVFIHAMIQDGDGQKMSKSLGNGVDPLDIIASHGADAMRYTLAAMTTHTQDLRMPVDLVDPHSGQMFPPAKITNSSGYVVAAPIQQSPKDPSKKMVSSYGVTSGTVKPTPDMPLAKNTSSKFDLGRNFCNKIWNAVRFGLMNLGAANAGNVGATPASPGRVGARPASPAHADAPSKTSGDAGVAPTGRRATQASPLQDDWILTRFNRTVAECNAALAEYRFDVYAKSCYDFFWRDLCDWYLEAIKPAMKDPARAPQTADVLAAVLDGALRLMHPVIPFITETIWWRLNAARPQRGLPGVLECPPSPRLVKAKWPTAGPVNASAEQTFSGLQEVVGAIRQLRNDYKVDPKKPVTVSIAAPTEMAESIGTNRELIETLAVCTVKEVRAELPAPANAARIAAGGAEVFVEGLVDPAAEKQRAGKEREDLERQRAALKARLDNAAYVAKAPPRLVEESRQKLADIETKLAKLT